MNFFGNAQLVWYHKGTGTEMAVLVADKSLAKKMPASKKVHAVNLELPVVSVLQSDSVVYRFPVDIAESENQFYIDGIFAVLTGVKDEEFAGNRVDYRALIQTARALRKFLYVLPVTSVTKEDTWTGYVRTGKKRWIPLPCPRPQAIYNRITLRNLERSAEAVTARQHIQALGIPMFNPSYFDKGEIYSIIARSRAARYLPETYLSLTRGTLGQMLARHASVYLKPTGGSVGHGMLRIDRTSGGYRIAVLKHGETRSFQAEDLEDAWKIVRTNRLSGPYVIQNAKPLLRWQGRPCDFRVLLQKHRKTWQVVGIGVRVAGEGVITTHVPNGGSIVATQDVLNHHFGRRSTLIEQELREAVLLAAVAIDEYYHEKLGEMSMDMAIEDNGRIWFLEANSKPMKFDEKNIRKQSLAGVLTHLTELGSEAESTLRSTLTNMV